MATGPEIPHTPCELLEYPGQPGVGDGGVVLMYLLEKTLMLGETEGKRKRGRQRMRWLDSTTGSMDMNSSKLREMVRERNGNPCRYSFFFFLNYLFFN